MLIGDQDVHLTLNEFKIVALLGKYAGKVLTYDYLIKQIWGPKAKADNQILRVNMANIRRRSRRIPPRRVYLYRDRRGLPDARKRRMMIEPLAAL